MFRTREFNVLHAASTASGETQGQVHVSRHAVYNTHSDSRVTEGQVHCHELGWQGTDTVLKTKLFVKRLKIRGTVLLTHFHFTIYSLYNTVTDTRQATELS